MQIRLSPAHPESGKLNVAQLEDRIRRRAYEMFECRGCEHGHDLEDWLLAKDEVLGIVKVKTQANAS